MDVDLKTKLGSLELRSPIIVGSCPITANDLQRISIVNSGAGAIVLPSIFAESKHAEPPHSSGNFQSIEEHLQLVEHVAKLETIPVIASLNGNLRDKWEKLPSRLESAGAAAIELSLRLSGSTNKDPRDIEDQIVALTSSVSETIQVPLFLKLTRNVTNISHFAKRLSPHVQGLVLFGRSPVIDIELDSLKLSTSWGLTHSGSVVQSLESIMRTQEEFPQMPLAACGGIGTSGDLIKALIAGADAAMVTSALYRNGAGVIGTLKDGLAKFMSDHGVYTIPDLRSLCPRLSNVQSAIDTSDYQSTVSHNIQTNSGSLDDQIQCDRFGHPRQ